MEGKTVSRKDVTRRQFSLISRLLPLLCPLLLSFSPPSPPLFITISHLRSIFARFPPPPILSLYTFARLQNRDKNDHTGNGKLSATYDSILLERNIARANACASRIVNLELRDALWIFRFWGERRRRRRGRTNREIFFSTERGVVKAIRYLFSIREYVILSRFNFIGFCFVM